MRGASDDLVQRAVEELRPLAAQALAQATQHGRTPVSAGIGAGPRVLVERLVQDVLDGHAQGMVRQGRAPLSAQVEEQVRRVLIDTFAGLGGLQPLLDDPTIETININGCDRVFVRYRDGSGAQVAPVADSDEALVAMLREMGAKGGAHERRFDHGSAQLSLALPGGARLHALMDVTDRVAVSIRRHPATHITLPDLVGAGEMSEGLAHLLAAMVRARRNIVISGAPAAGKTTLLRALAGMIPPTERIMTIEDAYELKLSRDEHPDQVPMQVREPNTEGAGGIDMGWLLAACLRMAPDRVFVGEIRDGGAARQMANAMTIGVDGSMTTVHASSSLHALDRLIDYALAPGAGYTLEAATRLIAGAVHVVVHLEVAADGTRVVSSVREVLGTDRGEGISVVSTNEIYQPGPGPHGRAVPGTPP
jgi:pilus assembly protein CpaF